jgi:hypothetical protein
MSVQRFLLAAFKRSLATMGAEEITIGNMKILAIQDETASSNSLGTGAKNNERNLTVKFAADAYTLPIKSGQRVTARGQQWQVSAEPESIRKGPVAITLELVEPERRSE